MRNVPLDNRLHDWEDLHKTKTISGITYAVYVCRNCNMKGFKVNANNRWLDVKTSNPIDLIEFCNHAEDPYIDKWIITDGCIAEHSEYRKLLKDGVEAKIVEPPYSHKNGKGGVFVMGLNEPVRLLWDEFQFKPESYTPQMIRTKKKAKLQRTTKPKLMRKIGWTKEEVQNTPKPMQRTKKVKLMKRTK